MKVTRPVTSIIGVQNMIGGDEDLEEIQEGLGLTPVDPTDGVRSPDLEDADDEEIVAAAKPKSKAARLFLRHDESEEVDEALVPASGVVSDNGASMSSSCSNPGVLPQVFDTWVRDRRVSGFKLPWETGPMARVFGASTSTSLFRLPQVGAFHALHHQSVQSGTEPSHAVVATDFAKRRLRFASLIKTDDAARWESLRRMKVLVMSDISSTKLGRMLMTQAGQLNQESVLVSSFNDVFASKSTNTMIKRTASMWNFAKWVLDEGMGSPLAPSEFTVYRYLLYLRQNGSPTSGRSFVEAMTFFHHTVGFATQSLDLLLSSRVRGAASQMYATKRKLVQARPLEVSMVLALERIVCEGPYRHWRIIAGHLSMCLGSSRRFADSQHLDSLQLTSASTTYLIEAESKKYKTATNEERKTTLLPLLSLGHFFSKKPWAVQWFKERFEAGLKSDPALPAWSEIDAKWLTRPMSTGEATLYLKEFLVGSRFKVSDLTNIGCHSLKCTVLSWAAKGNYMTLPDRRLLGHHLDPAAASPVTYSRDELTRLMKSVNDMVVDIRERKFKPDASRVWRLAALIDSGNPASGLGVKVIRGDPTILDSDGDDEDEGKLDPTEADLTVPTLPGSHPRDGLFDQFAEDCLVHKISKVVHFKASETRFFCGRMVTKNYEEPDPFTELTDMPMCGQCQQAHK